MKGVIEAAFAADPEIRLAVHAEARGLSPLPVCGPSQINEYTSGARAFS